MQPLPAWAQRDHLGHDYWRISGITGGLILLLGFYVATGLASQQLQGRLTRRVLVEYALVALVGLVVLLRFGP